MPSAADQDFDRRSSGRRRDFARAVALSSSELKGRAIDTEGNSLFKSRFTQLVLIEWGSPTEQRALHDAVTSTFAMATTAMKVAQTAVGS